MGRPNGKWISNQSLMWVQWEWGAGRWGGTIWFHVKVQALPWDAHWTWQCSWGQQVLLFIHGQSGRGLLDCGGSDTLEGCCSAVCEGLSTEGAKKHCCHSTQITEVALAVNTYSPKKGNEYPPKSKSMMTLQIQFHITGGKRLLPIPVFWGKPL